MAYDPYGGGLNGLSSLSSIGGAGNPISLAMGAAGLGLSIYGGLQESKIEGQEAQVSASIASDEEQINKQRQQLATLTYNRQTTENIRQAQMGAARAKAAGVNQGAQFGSGSVAGVEHASSEQAFNQQNLNQNYTIGQNIFGLTSQIDQSQIQLAQLGGAAAGAAGIAGLGGALMGGSMAAGRLTGGFGATG